jgi:SAM-dependent methyltransferase
VSSGDRAREAVAPCADDGLAFRTAVERAAKRFRPGGRAAYHFARGKLGTDPVFAALLKQGLIPSGARIVDIGCGQGVLAALLAAAETAPTWPGEFAPAPHAWTLTGFDLRTGAVRRGRQALSDLGARVALRVGDARHEALPACDVAVILDVLHYIEFIGQEGVLRRVHEALVPGGKLLLRVGDASRGLRFRVTLIGEWLITLIRGTPWPRFWCRSQPEWIALLEELGFQVMATPMSEGTPFANVLLVCRRAAPMSKASARE